MGRTTETEPKTTRGLRWSRGDEWTQAYLAARSGEAVRIVSDAERGKIKRVKPLVNIATALGVTPGTYLDISLGVKANRRSANLGGWARHRSKPK